MRTPISASDALWQFDAFRCLRALPEAVTSTPVLNAQTDAKTDTKTDGGTGSEPGIESVIESGSDNAVSRPKLVVACSGGVDSMTLLHALARLYPEQVRAIHINHQIHPDSADWADRVARQCDQLNIPCQCIAVQLASGNLEQQARAARYQALIDATDESECVVLGHQQEDQAETLMMRLVHGSFPAALGGMQPLSLRQQRRFWRPWLGVSRADIEWLAEQFGLTPLVVQDPANAELRYDRVFLRQQIFSPLSQRWPHASQGIARSMGHLQEAVALLDETLDEQLAQCSTAESLSWASLSQWGEIRQKWLLRRWLQQQEPFAPPQTILAAILAMQHQRPDAHTRVDWAQWQFRSYRGVLYRLPRRRVVACALDMNLPGRGESLHWSLPSGEWRVQALGSTADGWEFTQLSVASLPLSGNVPEPEDYGVRDSPQRIGMLVLPAASHQVENGTQTQIQAHTQAQEQAQTLALRARQGGEHIRVSGKTIALKHWLQEQGMPPWQREQVHLVWHGNCIVLLLTPAGVLITDEGRNQAANTVESTLENSVESRADRIGGVAARS